MYLRDTGDLSYYVNQATEIEYPDVLTTRLNEVEYADRPLTVIHSEFESFYDMTLEECIAKALQNTKTIRGFGTPGLNNARVNPGVDDLSNGPNGAGTLWNVAIRETEPGFIGTPGQISAPGAITTNTGLDGNQGVEAALADFDAQYTSSVIWSRSDEPRNVLDNFSTFQDFQQDQVQWQSEIAKKTANGTQIFFRNVNSYTDNNIPLFSDPINPGFQVQNSTYRSALEAEIRQPLLRGRGAFIQRMPVVISRIGSDQEIANLEAQMQNLVTNVEIRYWELHCAYRSLEASKTGFKAALETWRIVSDQFNEGADVNIQQVAQSEGQVHTFDQQVNEALQTLFLAERNLRWLMGLASTDGELVRPIDEPVMAPIEFDWQGSKSEALCYRPELRQTRWEVKKRELALAYSKNGLLPELNVTALYRWLGLGDDYANYDGNPPPFPANGSGALNELFGGNYQEFQFSGEFRMPIGFRRELANVRNAQLKLSRERNRLENQEADVVRQLSDAIGALDFNRVSMQKAFNSWGTAKVEEQHFQELANAGAETLDVALDAQRRRAIAEISFYSALCEYNKLIALVHRRKGTILSYNGVCFAEGPWTGKAYHDAQEHARRRSASRELNYGWTRPEVISQGGIWPANGEMQDAPYYDGEVQIIDPMTPSEMNMAPGMQIIPEVIDTPIADPLPMPNLNGSSTRNQSIPSNVRQAAYETAGPSPVVQAGYSDDGANRIVSQNRTYTKQIKAHTPAAGQTTNPPPAPSRQMDWSKLGMSAPERVSGPTQARIRSGN